MPEDLFDREESEKEKTTTKKSKYLSSFFSL